MLIFDFEVFMYDWLVIFKDVASQEYTIIINNKEELQNFYEKNKKKIWIGYNSKSYDNTILAGILSNVDPYTISTMIIKETPIYSIYKLLQIKKLELISMDLMQDVLGMSLKEAEGYMNMSVEESSIPFDIERKLTENEIKETIKYCKHDVDATEQLLHYRESYISAKMNLCKLFNISLDNLDKTNAGLVGIVLDAHKKDRDDELIYDLPKEVVINNPKYRKILDLYIGHELNYENKMAIDIAGVPHILAYGGIHAAKDNFFYKGEMWHIDVNSFYPSLMIQYNFHSRNIKDPQKFIDIYNKRIEAKKAGNKTLAGTLKLVINTTYGCMKSKYSSLYDPKMANQVCITGQLLFVDLIEKLEPYITLIQSNTDGIIVIPHNKDKIKEIVTEWENRTRMTVGIDIYTKIYQKDVNNYIIEDDKGNIEVKGGYVSQFYQNEKDVELRNTSRILDFAIVNYFLYGIKPEETIFTCNDKSMFQIITKTGGTYDATYWKSSTGTKLVNKVNRVFASKNKLHGNLYKSKQVTKKTGETVTQYDSIASLPEHCIVDNKNSLLINAIDKQWYVDMAYKKINDFKE